MRRIALVLMILLPGAAGAWERLDGAGLQAALEDRRVIYDSGAWQEFRASGRTLYNAGRDSWGYWAVRDDQYCSQWPPSDLWACYGLEQSGAALRFVGKSGDITQGRYAD